MTYLRAHWRLLLAALVTALAVHALMDWSSRRIWEGPRTVVWWN